MRVSTSMSLRTTMRDLNDSLLRLQDTQRKLSSGKAVERMSDDPRAGSDMLFLRAQLRRHDQTARTAEDTRARLAVADTTLVSASDLLIRAKELTVQASNSGGTDATSRAAIAAELRGLREELLGAANTGYLGRSLFAGTTSGAAYDATNGAYLGDTVVQQRTVSDGVTVAGNVTGPQIFGDPASPSGDVFAVLDRLATAVDAGDLAAITVEHGRLDQARTTMSGAIAEVGRRVANLEDLAERNTVRRNALTERLSQVEDVDLAETIVESQTRSNAYEAALAAVARSTPPSLVSFLR